MGVFEEFINVIDFLTFDMLDLNKSKDEPRREALETLETSERRRLEIEDRKIKIAEDLLAEGKPIRDALSQAGLGVLPTLTEFATGAPGGDFGLDVALERGTKKIFGSLAPFGLTDSSVAGEAVGELTSSLLIGDEARRAAEESRRISVGQSLLGLQPQTAGTAASLLGTTGGPSVAPSVADLISQKPQGNIADIGDLILSLVGFKGGQELGLFGSSGTSGGGTTTPLI